MNEGRRGVQADSHRHRDAEPDTDAQTEAQTQTHRHTDTDAQTETETETETETDRHHATQPYVANSGTASAQRKEKQWHQPMSYMHRCCSCTHSPAVIWSWQRWNMATAWGKSRFMRCMRPAIHKNRAPLGYFSSVFFSTASAVGRCKSKRSE